MKLYDTETMIRVNEAKLILRNQFVSSKQGAQRLMVVDTTAGSSQGYDFTVVQATYETVDFGEVQDTYWNYDTKTDALLESFVAHAPDMKNTLGSKGAYVVVLDRAKFMALIQTHHNKQKVLA